MIRRAARWRPVVAVVGGFLLCAPLVARAQPDIEAQRQAFAAAYRAAEAGLPAPAEGDATLLVEYPLYPYLQAARLRTAIGRAPTGAPDTEVGAFLERHAAEPVARLLRRPWLMNLAARRQWETFLRFYGQARAPDQALRCWALQARLATGTSEGLAEDATAEWLTPKSAEDACDPVFDWMKARGVLTPALVEQRARLALAGGQTQLARWLARSLPEESARPLREWALFIENPRAAIDAVMGSPATPVEDQALLDGWTLLARRDPHAARERIDRLAAARPGLGSQLARALALGLAWSRHPVALEYFARVEPADYDETTHEWHARAALWAGNWPRVASSIAAMPEALRDSPRWRYFAARAAEVAGETDRARQLYAAVVPSDNWFAVLSAARLGERFAPHDRPVALDPVRIAELERQPAFLRARELFLAEIIPLAQSEWNAGYAALDEAQQRDAVGLAHQWGWHFLAIATAAQQGLFDDYRLLYPRPFDAAVKDAATLSALPDTLVYAVIRQESLYQPWAESSAGAIGLMQLLPGTARDTARALRLQRPTQATLRQPDVNVALGAAHLAELIDRFDGQVLLALASYNAGPGATRRWLPDRSLEADIWVENIPYNETRGYVQRIMWHSVVFEWLKDGAAEDASSWLGRVEPDGD